MMGTQAAPERLFYDFCLDEHIPEDHMLRQIDSFLDLSGVRRDLQPFYSRIGRPSIDPELMIRILIVGYCFAIRSERRLCEEVHLNLAYRWFCRLGLEGKVPDHSTSRSTAMAASVRATFSAMSLRPWCAAAWPKVWWAGKDLLLMPA
jgi:transposase